MLRSFIRIFICPQVHLLLELVTGGDLFDALTKLGALTRYQGQFYTASIAMGYVSSNSKLERIFSNFELLF